MTTWYPAQPITMGLEAWDAERAQSAWLEYLSWLIPHGLTCESNTCDCSALYAKEIRL